MPNRSVVVSLYALVLSCILTVFPSTALAGQVTLSWNVNSEPDMRGYNLYFGTQSGTYNAPGSPIFIEHPQNSITVTGLQSNQGYYFSLTAVDQSGNSSSLTQEVHGVATGTNPLPDTTPPTVTLTQPADQSSVSGTITVSASSSDNLGVAGVQFQLNGENLGTEDTTKEYQISWDTTGTLPGPYTLTAIARDGAGNTTVSNPVTVTVSPPSNVLVTNLKIQNGKTYQVRPNGLVPGATMYIDRSYTFTNIPEGQLGATYIQTANTDKSSSGASWISFDVNQPVTIYIAHDPRIKTKPSWLQNFTNTGKLIQNSDNPLEIWSLDFPAGNIALGGNRGSSENASMYSVSIVGKGIVPTKDTTPPSATSMISAVPDSPTQANITWSAAVDNVGVTGYTLYRNNTKVVTTPNLTYTDSNLLPSTSYSYFVVAHDAAENTSSPSSPISLETPAPVDTTPPTTPIIESAVANSPTQSTISWSAATDNVAVTSYTLYRNNNPLATTQNLFFVDSNLSPATTYQYFVSANDERGNTSTPSAIVSIKTQDPPDTTFPSVAITTPTVGSIVSGTALITATAEDNVGVVGVQFQLNGATLGAEDTTNAYSVSWDTSAVLSGSFTLTAIARDAAGNTTTSAPVVVSVDNGGITNSGTLEVSNLEVQNGKKYIIANNALKTGQTVYLDRSYSFKTVPSSLTGATYVQTANNDKNSNANDFLRFTVNQTVMVYVAHDPRISKKPEWLQGFSKSEQTIQTSDTTLEIWMKTFPAGPVSLGGNRGSSEGASMYSVAIMGQGSSPSADTTPPSIPALQSVVADSSTQATISWSAATDNVGVTGYVLYRDNGLLTTTSNLTYVDTNLDPSTTYAYSIAAQDAEKNVSAKSSSISVTTLPVTSSEPPGAPTIQSVTADSDSQMTINWMPAIKDVIAGVKGSVILGAATYCPTLDPPNSSQTIYSVASGDVGDLLSKVSSALPGSTILLADGEYALQSNQSLTINTPGLTIRSASGNREAVKITGGYNNITVKVDDVTIADLTLTQPTNHNIQVRGELGITGTKIYNVHMVDAGQQFVKISAGDGTNGKFADNGLVACSRIEYTTFSKGTSNSAPSYTNGVDLLAGKGWIIRDNEFRRIRSEAGPAGPAILAWKNSMDTIIQRNLIVDSWRGIALGLSAPNHLSRGGAGVTYDHQNGIVENNVILALNKPADAAIENNYALNSQVQHNTIFYNPTLSHSVNWSIEYRFEPTTVTLTSNLSNYPILARSPQPTQAGILQDNISDAQLNWFIDIMSEQYHLATNSQGSEAASFTLYRDGVPVGSTTEWSYQDSYLSPSTIYKYSVTALDAHGNESSPSHPVTGTTLAPADSTPPQVAITFPSIGDIVSGVITVSATASDNIGVIGVQFLVNEAPLAPMDTTNHFSTTWDTTTVAPGTYTLTAQTWDAAGNSTTSSPVTVTIPKAMETTDLEITNLTVGSGKVYAVVPKGLISGAKSYIDRSFTFTNLPSLFTEATYIQTANNDKNSNGESFLRFTVNQPVTVYIAHDSRITTKPSWLTSFNPTGQTFKTTDTTLEIFERSFPTGTVSLGGNSGGGNSMYSVAVLPDLDLGQGANHENFPAQDTTPPSGTSITSALANSSTQATITWAPSTDNTSVIGYHVHRNGILISTTTDLIFTDTGLSPSTSYIYSIQSLDAAGNVSTMSPGVQISTHSQESATNQGTAQLSWMKNSEPDLSHYMVYYGTSSKTYFKSINVGLTPTANFPSYTITNLAPGTYFFTIVAVDSSGNESPPAPEKTKIVSN